MVIKVKYNGEWVKIPYLSVNEDSGVNYVEEAPKDGNQYTRKDGVWTVLNIPDDITETINNKVDKVDGKDLSTNDYTNADKTKVDNLTSVLVDADIAQTEFAATITLDKIDLSTGTTSDVEIELPASTTVLSGLMTAADKTKLNSIAVGAEVNVNADWNSTGGDSQILNKPDLTKPNNLPTWVFDAVNLNTEEGDDYITVHSTRKNLETGETSKIGSTIYVASSEHIGYMSPADKTILDGLAANAITSTEVDQKINSAIASVYKIKGTVANYEALPTTDVTIGDVYNLEDTGANYVATSTTPTWYKLSETVDLSAYSTTAQNDSKYQPIGDYVTDETLTSELSNKVDKDGSKVLSTNDFTTTLKNKLDGITESADSVSFTRNLTSGTKIGTITINGSAIDLFCQTDTNTHYVTHLYACSNDGTGNETTTNGNTYLRLFDDSTARSSIKFAGSGAASVSSDASGNIIINSTNTTYSQATSSTLGLVKIGYTESGKNYPVELSNGQMYVNVPWTDTNTTYSVVGTNGSTGLVKNGSSVTSTSGYTACPIISGVPYYKDTNTTYTLSSFGITATAAELNKLDGCTATVTELNYVDGVTSNIQTQLNNKSAKITVSSGGSGEVTKQLSPNVYYEFGECTSLTITLAAETSGIYNEYMFEFVSGSTATTLALPDSITWMNGEAPTIAASKTYQVSIVNNLAIIAEF